MLFDTSTRPEPADAYFLGNHTGWKQPLPSGRMSSTGSYITPSQQGAYYYVSPIAEINQDIRRQNSAAAASFHSTTTATVGTTWSSSDPWEEEMDEVAIDGVGGGGAPFLSSTPSFRQCTCRVRRRTLSAAAAVQQPSPEEEKGGDCPRCGKKRVVESSLLSGSKGGFAWSSSSSHNKPATTTSSGQPRRSTSFYALVTAPTATGTALLVMPEPNHAQALLQSTPQLRFLSPASTDLQGGGNATSNNLLQQLVQAAVESTTGGVGQFSTSWWLVARQR